MSKLPDCQKKSYWTFDINDFLLFLHQQHHNNIMSTAYFSAGCFWGVEYYFKRLRGILFTQVGFMGGDLENPSYKEVKTGTTGHLETIRVNYDPEVVSYEA